MDCTPWAKVAPLLAMVGDWRSLISLPADEDEVDALRRHQRTGRLLGDDAIVDRLETTLGRPLRRRKPGPKPQTERKQASHIIDVR